MLWHMLDTRRLRVLVEVARHGSMGAAARALDYTQPAVSHHVARLEEEAGVPLVVRLGRGVRLTEAGERLLVHAEAVTARLRLASEELADLAGLRAGRVRLAAFPSGAATLLPAAIADLRARHPDVAVSLVEVEPPDSAALLRAGECDVALSFAYGEPDPDPATDVVSTPLLDDPVRAVLPPGHRLASRSPVPLEALRDETWISGCPRCRAQLVDSCHAAGFAPRIAFSTDDYLAVQQLVARGVGVALLPSLALASAQLPGIVVRPVAGVGPRSVAALVLAGGPPAPATAAMLAALVRAAAALGGPSA